jgi:hypothetical protein
MRILDIFVRAMAGNYDITDIFCDATLRICGSDMDQFAAMVEKLLKITTANGLSIIFTLSCRLEDCPKESAALPFSEYARPRWALICPHMGGEVPRFAAGGQWF